MRSPSLLSSNPLLCSEQLKQQTDELRCKIVRTNGSTQFALAASELAEFRHATANLTDNTDDGTLSDLFRQTVHLTTYDSYAPFTTRLLDRPCKASALVNLLAPGLPDYIAGSSSTSGGLPKTFPGYNFFQKLRSPNSSPTPDPLHKRTTLDLWYLWCDRMDVEDEDHCSTRSIYDTLASAMFRRIKLNLDPEEDEKKMGTFSMMRIIQPLFFC